MKTTLFFKVCALYAIVGFLGYQSVAVALWYTNPSFAQAKIPANDSSHLLASADTPSSSQTDETPSSKQNERTISPATITEAVPAEGKFIAADLVNMKLSLYQDGQKINEFDIQSKGRPNTPWETPSGLYSIKTKEKTHFSSIGKVYMPYSMQFYGNYFIHGWTYYPDGSPTSANFSGGCIKLHTEDAVQVFNFANLGTQVFVYDKKNMSEVPPLSLSPISIPSLSAQAYLVADIDTGDVYLEKNAQEVRPIASITKLMTALVANESISLYREIPVAEGGLSNPPQLENTTEKIFVVGDLFYPLLMQSSNLVAESISAYYGKSAFINLMNATARAHDMKNTTFADASGAASGNISTPDDLFKLAAYIANKKAFLFKITSTHNKIITATDGTNYAIKNLNTPANVLPFIGGKTGHTTAAGDTMLSVLEVFADAEKTTTHRIAIIVLASDDRATDTTRLADWIINSVKTSPNSLEETEFRKVKVD
jgi:D-alanyl-D-alanine carboxypeptidase/lipoprotein-anchoring transpeptidase ErfK/SrfK